MDAEASKAQEAERAVAEMQVHAERLREAEGLTESKSSRNWRRNMHSNWKSHSCLVEAMQQEELEARAQHVKTSGGVSVRVVSKSWKLRQKPRPSEERS